MDAEIFFEMKEEKIFEILEIKKPGVKYRITNKIKEIKEKLEKSKAAP